MVAKEFQKLRRKPRFSDLGGYRVVSSRFRVHRLSKQTRTAGRTAHEVFRAYAHGGRFLDRRINVNLADFLSGSVEVRHLRFQPHLENVPPCKLGMLFAS